MPTENTVIPFGGPRFRGRRMRELSDDTLRWCATTWREGDFAEWAAVAQKVLDERREHGLADQGDLEQQADAILRAAGCGDLARPPRRTRQWSTSFRR